MFEPRLIFAVLGPAFLLLALVRGVVARRLVPQARAWFCAGAIFTAIDAWLWISHAQGR